MRAQPSRNVSAAIHQPARYLDFELSPRRMMPVDAFYCRDAPSRLATVQMSTPACVVGAQGGHNHHGNRRIRSATMSVATTIQHVRRSRRSLSSRLS